MIELKKDNLQFTFPKVHPQAKLNIDFMRTLRIPDDGKTYPLPPGLGKFPLKHVDDFSENIPESWITHGGVMLPMYQSEALWIYFNASAVSGHRTRYPFAIKVATGKINAVTGQNWKDSLNRKPQDYMVSKEQPWLDGYCVEKGFIRQFVAMPLDSGYTTEEQITGKAVHGGLQIIVYPMKREVFERRFPKRDEASVLYSKNLEILACEKISINEMGLAPGGRMKQEIYQDTFDLEDWDTENSSRCFVHIANSLTWRAITGEDPPTVPYTSKEYTKHGLPWFDYYNDAPALDGSKKFKGIKSVAEMGKEKGDVPLPENETVSVENTIKLNKDLKKDQVREGLF